MVMTQNNPMDADGARYGKGSSREGKLVKPQDTHLSRQFDVVLGRENSTEGLASHISHQDSYSDADTFENRQPMRSGWGQREGGARTPNDYNRPATGVRHIEPKELLLGLHRQLGMAGIKHTYSNN